ncbi:hypothetical protein [Acinetobacter sp.]|uniref:hypothetical protein n=1 Tax=Acinetobacter sp. TaxID=472 RepID=UPI002FCB6DA7
MKVKHFFLSQIDPSNGDHRFTSLGFFIYAGVYCIDGISYYSHVIEYKDAIFYIYVPKRLFGQEYNKLVSDLLKFSPGELA